MQNGTEMKILGVLSLSLLSASVYAKSLKFDANKNYSVQTIQVDGQSLQVRAYENISYVKKPVDPEYEVMNIYIPEAYFQQKNIGRYNAQNAPIFFPNDVGGYMPAKPTPLVSQRGDTTVRALAHGYVVASAGARGRTSALGKAPAAIVDLKAAVRYLKYNDKYMPGNAEKIVSNGTSAGGAMSVLLGATGDNPDYLPYLKKLGAAPTSDKIFAVSAYCPITDLDHADMAYEWQFNQIHNYKKIDISMLDYKVQRKETAGTLTTAQIQTSNELSQLFPQYVNQLNLKNNKGQSLTLDQQGHGSFEQLIKSYVIQSAQTAINNGENLSQYSWIKQQNGRVVDIDYNQYLGYLQRQKTPPAFDALDLSSGENQEFGTKTIDKQHFTEYSYQHRTNANATMADAHIIKMMNPLRYMTQTSTSQHWRIRHGAYDKDTSLAVPTILATTLQNKGYQVDFALPWGRPHSGDYDLKELFTWIDGVVNE